MFYLLLLLIKICIILGIVSALLKLTINWDKSAACLVGKTIIVTGANTGIGYYTALDFAKRGAKVILACRSENKAEAARDKIIKATGNGNVHVRLVDFSSLDSVRDFAKEINSTEERLDVLVNNAGLGWIDHETSQDGLNLVIQVNHFAPFLLTNLLIDLLKKSVPSRVVNVASIAAMFENLDVNDLNAVQGRYFLGKIADYSNSKLLNILFTQELAKRLGGCGVTANSLHPGSVVTDLFRNFSPFIKPFTWIYMNLFFKTAEEGAQTSIHLALSKDVRGVSGEFFQNCRKSWFPGLLRKARDERVAKEVWEKSEEFVKLTEKERRL